jgi:hypothetical protein
LDLELPLEALAGSNVTGLADVTCVVVRAAITSSDALKAMDSQLAYRSPQQCFFILNRWRDPLPLRLRI